MRSFAKRLIESLGYTLRRRDTPPEFRSAYRDMQYLLRNVGDAVIFDVGAYHGYVAKDMLRLFPGAEVIAIEADPLAFQEMQKVCRNEPRMRLVNRAISDLSGTISFHRNENAATNSLLAFTEDPAARSSWAHATSFDSLETITVEAATIDQVSSELKIDRIDLLKLDVQGAELKVLNGAWRLLGEGAIRYVYAEMLMEKSYKGQPTPSEFLRAFESHGFSVHNMYNPMNSTSGKMLQCDVLFERVR